MKQFFFSVILYTPQFLFSQVPYSTTTMAEDFLSLQINAAEFNGKHYVIDEEYCFDFFEPGCTIISEVLPNGALSKVGEVENFQIASNAITANANIFTVIGKSQLDSFTIVQFDTAWNEINRKSYFQENHIWTFGIMEFGSYFVVSTRDFQGAEDYFESYLYWIAKSDLAMIETMEGVPFRNVSMVEMKISPDTLLNIFSMTADSVYVLQFDRFRNLAGVIQTPSDEFIQNANFEMLANHYLVYGLVQNALLNCIDTSGGLVWQVDLAAQFEVPALQFIQEIVEAGNGDILVCGTIYQSRSAFIARISNAGEVLWSRTYQVENAKESFLFDLTETIDSSILFAGSVKMVEPSETSAHDYYWMLLTDPDGCIDSTCTLATDFDKDGYTSDVDCNDFDPNINPGQLEIPDNLIDENCDGLDGTTHLNETSSIEYALWPNPTARYITVVSTDNIQYAQYSILDMMGVPLLNGVLTNKLDLDPLSPGLYILTIQNDVSKILFASKIIKVE